MASPIRLRSSQKSRSLQGLYQSLSDDSMAESTTSSVVDLVCDGRSIRGAFTSPLGPGSDTSSEEDCFYDEADSLLFTEYADDHDDYIFTDDDSVAASPRLLTDPEREALVRHFDLPQHSMVSPSSWTTYNQERGKQVAQVLLQRALEKNPIKPPSNGSTLSDHSSNTSEEDASHQLKEPSSHGRHRRKSLLFRAWKGMRRKSKAAAAVDQPPLTVADDDVSTAPGSPASSQATVLNESFAAWQTQLNLEDTSFALEEEEEEVTALESRASSREIIEALQLGHEAEQLVDSLHRRTGKVDTETTTTTTTTTTLTTTSASCLPMMEVGDDFWVPQYEEYVVRAVNALAQYLTGSAV